MSHFHLFSSITVVLVAITSTKAYRENKEPEALLSWKMLQMQCGVYCQPVLIVWFSERHKDL